jgi:sulfhydrogenase subunit beta (sulfur reductase)
MSNWTLDKSDIAGFLSDLGKEHRVFAPVRRNDLVSFEPLDSGEEADLGAGNSDVPPKQVFFPRSETLFTYEGGEVTAVPMEEESRVIFGIRPCDAASLVVLDQVFNSADSQDPYYARRRENTAVIGLGCDRPVSTCFCTAVGGGPFAVEGLDLLLTDLGDRYLVEAVTERGQALAEGNPLLREAVEADERLKAEIVARAEQAVSGPSTKGLKAKLDVMYDDPFWAEVHQKCLGCATCTYLCPTCHCFDIGDESEQGRGRRVRNWDSCQFPLFTLHASGHNPRPSGQERMRQRVMHKFRYFVDNFEMVACVGCGRCVGKCPVNLDIREVIEAIEAS